MDWPSEAWTVENMDVKGGRRERRKEMIVVVCVRQQYLTHNNSRDHVFSSAAGFFTTLTAGRLVMLSSITSRMRLFTPKGKATDMRPSTDLACN